jgi:transcriptional regulator with XRE-family HTH domain
MRSNLGQRNEMILRGDYRHNKAVPDVLRSLRIAAGLRQEDLAKKIGSPQSFISKYENGERRLDVIEARTICLALGVTLGDFFVLLERKIGELHES